MSRLPLPILGVDRPRPRLPRDLRGVVERMIPRIQEVGMTRRYRGMTPSELGFCPRTLDRVPRAGPLRAVPFR